MSAIETQLKSRLVSVELVSTYRSLLEKATRELSKIELELVMNMLRYQTKYPLGGGCPRCWEGPDKTPWVRLEITFNPSIEPTVKKDELFEKTGSSAEIRHRNVFIIDAFITLQNLEALARDKDIEYITGEINPSFQY